MPNPRPFARNSGLVQACKAAMTQWLEDRLWHLTNLSARPALPLMRCVTAALGRRSPSPGFSLFPPEHYEDQTRWYAKGKNQAPGTEQTSTPYTVSVISTKNTFGFHFLIYALLALLGWHFSFSLMGENLKLICLLSQHQQEVSCIWESRALSEHVLELNNAH